MKNFFSGVHAAIRLVSTRSEPLYLKDEDEDPRPEECCGVCPPIAGGGYDCTCRNSPRCRKATEL